MGVLWFLLALAAVTSGRWWTAALWSMVAALSAFQTVRAWQLETAPSEVAPANDRDGSDAPVDGLGLAIRLGAAGAAAVVPLAAAYGTGVAGVALAVVALACGAFQLATWGRPALAGPVSIGVLVSSIAAASVVLAVRVDLWAGLFLVLAVSLYDAGCYLMGADAAGRWEGPVAGVLGALAVTFTLATIDPPPFDRVGTWLAGLSVAIMCVPGQWAVSALLPRTTARAPALRRLDAYVLAGPTFVALAWALGS